MRKKKPELCGVVVYGARSIRLPRDDINWTGRISSQSSNKVVLAYISDKFRIRIDFSNVRANRGEPLLINLLDLIKKSFFAIVPEKIPEKHSCE